MLLRKWRSLLCPTESTRIPAIPCGSRRNPGGWSEFGRNVILVRTHPNFTQTPTKFPPNSHHSYQTHLDPHGSQSYQDPTKFRAESAWNPGIPSRFQVDSQPRQSYQIPPGIRLESRHSRQIPGRIWSESQVGLTGKISVIT